MPSLVCRSFSFPEYTFINDKVAEGTITASAAATPAAATDLRYRELKLLAVQMLMQFKFLHILTEKTPLNASSMPKLSVDH